MASVRRAPEEQQNLVICVSQPIQQMLSHYFYILIVVITCSSTSANPVVFVSPEGNDDNTGLSQDSPIYSLRRAAEVLGGYVQSHPYASEYIVGVSGGNYFQNSIPTVLTDKDCPPSSFSKIIYKVIFVSNNN